MTISNHWPNNNGICTICNLPTTSGNHENCGTKHIDDPKTRAETKRRYKRNSKNYRKGKLPPWMYS